MNIKHFENNLEVLFLNGHIDRYAFELLQTFAEQEEDNFKKTTP